MRSPFRFSALVVFTVVAATSLGGCSLIPSEVSTAAACLQLKSSLDDLGADMTEASTDLANDPEGAAKKIEGIATKFEKVAKEVDNDELREASIKAAAAVRDFSDEITKFSKDPSNADVDAISESGQNVQTELSAVSDICD